MKKLATVLALTAVMANLGLATVFAQAVGSTGTQVIGCNANGGLTFDATRSLGFYSRSSNFNSETDANLENPLNVDNNPVYSKLTVSDTRGYDAAASTCGNGFTVSVQSTGLSRTTADGLFNINLATGTFGNSDLAEDQTYATSSPDTLIGSVVSTASSSDAPIATAVDLLDATEAFYGDVQLTLNSSNADNTVGSPNDATVLKAQHDNIEKDGSPYSGPIPTGSYTGTITFTLA